MSSRLGPLSLVVLCLAGCGKRAGSAPPAPVSATQPGPGPEAGDATAAAPSAPASGSQADLTAALGELTQALRKFSFEQRRVPKDISEVISAGYVKNVPQPPAGKKFGIDAKSVSVILVKQ